MKRLSACGLCHLTGVNGQSSHQQTRRLCLYVQVEHLELDKISSEWWQHRLLKRLTCLLQSQHWQSIWGRPLAEWWFPEHTGMPQNIRTARSHYTNGDLRSVLFVLICISSVPCDIKHLDYPLSLYEYLKAIAQVFDGIQGTMIEACIHEEGIKHWISETSQHKLYYSTHILKMSLVHNWGGTIIHPRSLPPHTVPHFYTPLCLQYQHPASYQTTAADHLQVECIIDTKQTHVGAHWCPRMRLLVSGCFCKK